MRSFQNFAKRNARRVISGVSMPIWKTLDRQTLKDMQKAGPLSQKLAKAISLTIDGKASEPVVAQIEAGRTRMLGNHAPLADGSLGTPAMYDGKETVATACSRSMHAKGGLFLYNLARVFQPQCILEMGTNVGISAAYLRAGQGRGSLITMEVSPYRNRLARALHSAVGLGEIEYVEGNFSDTLTPTLLARRDIDMAFIDGNHQYQPTLDYFEAILAKAAPVCVFIFDDIRWSLGMEKAWNELQKKSRLSIVADLKRIGVCISGGTNRFHSPIIRSIAT